MAYFPQINPAALNALLNLKQQLEANPEMFSEEGCPYDEALITDLKTVLAPKIIETERIVEKRIEVPVASEGMGKRGPKSKAKVADNETIGKELQELIEDLRRLKVEGKSLQNADKIQIIKTRAALLEKMQTLSERHTNVKRMSQFMSVVLSILDDLMDDEKRQIFMKRIEPFAEEE